MLGPSPEKTSPKEIAASCVGADSAACGFWGPVLGQEADWPIFKQALFSPFFARTPIRLSQQFKFSPLKAFVGGETQIAKVDIFYIFLSRLYKEWTKMIFT